MTLTPEQIAEGWVLHDGGYRCPIKGDGTKFQVMGYGATASKASTCREDWYWPNVKAYRIIEAHGADAEPARPTPFPQSYADLVFTDDGWSQTIIVDGKRPVWLRDDDWLMSSASLLPMPADDFEGEFAVRVRRREPKRETVKANLRFQKPGTHWWSVCRDGTIDLIDGEPDLSTLKIGGEA